MTAKLFCFRLAFTSAFAQTSCYLSILFYRASTQDAMHAERVIVLANLSVRLSVSHILVLYLNGSTS